MTTKKTSRLTLAKLDHDLRSHLNVVLGFGAMAKNSIDESDFEKAKLDVNDMIAAARELLQLNTRVDDLRRLEQGGSIGPLGDIVLGESITQLCARENEFSSRLNFEVSGEGCVHTADVTACNHILEMIVSTLAKSIDEGSILIEIRSSGATVEVAFKPARNDGGKQPGRCLEYLASDLASLDSIDDFDAYYITTLSRIAGVRRHLGVDELVCEFVHR